ncbi:MAG: hypothetical protein SPK72_05385 [Bacteroidales bacterium]|nr:hypothetical protein [Bacteroidales bacterium]
MKRLSTIIMALALVLGMSQCKKQEIPTNGNGGEKVHITLNVNNGENISVNVDNGGRHAVAPNLGVIQFRNGDVLYVGNNGKYIGQLTYNNGAFSGPLNPPTGDDFLHFYFLGGKAPATAPTAGTTTDFTISIADQSQNLPVLCYGKSNEKYSTNGSYTATLEYKCALVKFNLNKETNYICTLSNMLTEATIDFANNAITPTATTGSIDLYREEGNTGVRWAILLPGTNLSADGNVIGEPSGTLNANQFINSGITLTNPVFAAPGADYAVKTNAGVLTQFSVSSTQKVYFSRANLKCNAANPNQLVWGFHENQIDECPSDDDNTTGNTQSGVNLDGGTELDRFSWGFHSPTTVSENDWVDGSRNLNWNDGTDWGCALRGTAYGNYWRTLTEDEWEYLLKSRSGKRFLKVTWKQLGGFPYYEYDLVTVNGIFIAPDDYNGGSASSLTWNNETTATYINRATMEGLFDDGCVFLPALGYRQGSYYYEYNYHYENGDWMTGNYWSATGGTQQPGSTQVPQATAFRFEKWSITYKSYPQRDRGMCVRLVWDAN